MVQAIEELPPNLRQAALEAFGAEQDRLRAPDAAAPEGVQPSAPPPEQRTIRRRIAEAADPSVRQELEEAYTDPKTGLRNQTAFSRAKSRLDADPNTELVIVDLDNFKAVNDALGHQAGDRFLATIGQAIVAAGRESDRVFRYGGDEFALILPGTDDSSALTVAERIRAAIHAIGEPGSTWADQAIRTSVSIGLATFPTDGLTPESILLAADRACFVAKRSGEGLIATADEGLSIAREFRLQEPTPVDPPTPPLEEAG
jgi:diguanylate cyclase (GGDEF)-like protein